MDIAVLKDEIVRFEITMGKREKQDIPNYTIQALEKVDALASRIDSLCNGRYKWEDMKNDLLQRWPNSQDDVLDQLLKEESKSST